MAGMSFPAPAVAGVPSFQHGSGGVRDVGSGTLAMLHGREAVVPAGGSGAAAGMTIVVNIRDSFYDTPESIQKLATEVGGAIMQSMKNKGWNA